MRCFFKLLLLLFIVVLCVGAVAAYQKGDSAGALKAGGAALVLIALGALSSKKKTKAKSNHTKTNKVPKYIGDAIIQAHSDLQGDTFKCAQCRRQHPIKAAASIDVRNWEEDVEPDDDDLEGETKTVIKHRYNGLICAKCARIVSGLRSDTHSYYTIPNDLRAGNE